MSRTVAKLVQQPKSLVSGTQYFKDVTICPLTTLSLPFTWDKWGHKLLLLDSRAGPARALVTDVLGVFTSKENALLNLASQGSGGQTWDLHNTSTSSGLNILICVMSPLASFDPYQTLLLSFVESTISKIQNYRWMTRNILIEFNSICGFGLITQNAPDTYNCLLGPMQCTRHLICSIMPSLTWGQS